MIMTATTAPMGEFETMKKSWPQDLLASVVVFLVALPLCLGVAIASGAPPALGLITGIIGGIVVGSLAGSPLQVSGPAAGLAVLCYQLVEEHGLIMMGVVGLIAGALQLMAGVARLGQWFRAISPSVIHGMLAGIGVLILGSQFHVMIDDSPRGSGLENLISIPEAIYKAVFPMAMDSHHLAAMVGVATIAAILLWNQFKPKSLAVVPAPLIAVIVGTLVALFAGFDINRVTVPDNIVASLNIPTAEAFQRGLSMDILLLGVVFAFVASAETLLCATAVDQMHTGPRTKYDKELRAQGIGNMLCGAVGALPMTGVIVRSSANVQAGGKSRLSAIMHGVWILGTVAALPWLLAYIPTAALAAILVYTGYKLVNIAQIKKIASYGRIELVIYFATLGGIVVFDLLTGVIIGFVLATAKVVYTFTHVRVDLEDDEMANRTDVFLHGSATFFSIPRLASVLETVKSGREVHVHVEHLDHIDHACLDMLGAWEKQHNATGGTMIMEWKDLRDRYASPYQKMQDQFDGNPDQPGEGPKKAPPVLEPAA
ncbi:MULTISPECIES: SulP family inorganic anion transporter [Blastomonas]|jgi:MFS superfamily sulfate permease-like transporter|uniref:SulP family inorganic anion transporter n=3 Tax=Sphingomonadaceae TaxID=41297 RepID=UPI0006B9CA59|nr:SulP family inorganic anion transporter [Blastomonas sp. AAP25]